MLWWDLCIKSLDYEKDCRGVLRAKMNHTGRIPMDTPEKYREVTQYAEGMSCITQSNTDSDCQSIWLARKQDVFNPSCCWLQCYWFHQICTMLSIQGPTLQHRSMKSHCSLACLLWMELFVQKSFDSGFNHCRLPVVRGNVELHRTSCTVKLELAIGCSRWFLSRCFSRKSVNVHWPWLLVSLVLAEGGRSGDARGSAAVG